MLVHSAGDNSYSYATDDSYSLERSWDIVPTAKYINVTVKSVYDPYIVSASYVVSIHTHSHAVSLHAVQS